MTSERLAIAQVTPFAWEASHEVNDYVARVSHELSRRGHRVLIIAPSESAALVRDSRRAIRNGADALLERADGEPLVLGVGEVLPGSPNRRRARVAAGRRGPDDRGGARQPAARRRPRARAVRAERVERRAAPLARAQRRDLPRADRADPLDPADGAAVASAVRPARRPHRELRRHPGPAPALLPRRLPRDPARRRRGLGAHRARSRAAAVQRPRGARRAAHLPARRSACSDRRRTGEPRSGRRDR